MTPHLIGALIVIVTGYAILLGVVFRVHYKRRKRLAALAASVRARHGSKQWCSKDLKELK